jgi:hypothetical protein
MKGVRLIAALVLFGVGCGKKDAAPQAAVSTSTGSAPSASSGRAPEAGAASDPAIDAWSAAASLEPEDLSRLALREGSAGIVAGATSDAKRKIAVHALAFGEDFDALPFLGEVAGGADAPLALAAADTAGVLAARRRMALAPEDALEVREGCDRLLAVAKDASKPRPLRLKVLRALRMLADRGCARELPKVE